MIAHLAGRPDIRVRVGRHTKPAGPASVEYRERGGPLGFGVGICRGANTEVSASRLLGWSPRYANAEALCRTYDWYLANRERFRAAGVTHRVPWNQQALALLRRIS